MLVFVVIVLVLMALALYAIHILPLIGAPGLIKPLLQVLAIVIAIVVIAGRAGIGLP